MKYIIPLSQIPESGMEQSFENQEFWLNRIEEFGILCKVLEPIKAKLFLFKQEEGCLIRGKIEGTLQFACDRCGEEANHTVSIEIDEFALKPNLFMETVDEDGNIISDLEEESIAIETNLIFEDSKGIFYVNIDSLLFEEFSLDLPIKPLCNPHCAGRCMHCGINKNESDCQCEKGKLDPRFEKLHNLKVTRKQ